MVDNLTVKSPEELIEVINKKDEIIADLSFSLAGSELALQNANTHNEDTF